MSLLLDRLRADKKWKTISFDTEDERTVKYWLTNESVPVYDITNVARYFSTSSLKGDGSGEWGTHFESFPNVAPPHRLYWMEIGNPAGIFEARNRDNCKYPERLGLVCWEEQPQDGERWFVACHAFGQWGKIVQPILSWQMEFVRDGFPELVKTHLYKEIHELFEDRPKLPHEEVEIPDITGMTKADVERKIAELEQRREEANQKVKELGLKIDAIWGRWTGYTLLYPALLAHSLLACKNVEQVQHRPDPKLSRAWQRRHGADALVRYTTLRVRPMGGGSHDGGDGQIDKALHIVRGHFKTYTPERPLFGRLTGTYWWDSAVRGDASHGVVVKDYEVVA